LAVVDPISSPAAAQRDVPSVRLGVLAQNGVIVH
jgi:hypothetical protein